MFLLTPRHLKEGKHYRHSLKRLIHYKEDILKPSDLETLRDLLDKIQAALKSRKREEIHRVREEIDQKVGKIIPPMPDAGWRENVEVFLVAIVVAAGIKAFFLQPFKIPTGSMQPTVFGIVGYPTDTPAPNILVRAFQFLWLGRSYFNVIAQDDEAVVSMREKTYLNFFTFTDVALTKSRLTIFAPKQTLENYFNVCEDDRFHSASVYRKGDPIVRGYVDTGDQVFVDKISYNFVTPQRGQVFVFKTTGIRDIPMPPGIDSQHYIKRLAGAPGTTLRIDSPRLFLDGKLADQFVFQRVMSLQNGYRGYSNDPRARFLTTPADSFTIPAHAYFALGDNSYNSLDSRFWGIVPAENVAGKGLFVYWPFSKRWGFIR